MCATEEGRRLYIFGGHDGSKLLNDVYYLEVERLMWSPVSAAGTAPEPREGHTASILGKYMLISGGCGLGSSMNGVMGVRQSTAGGGVGGSSAGGSAVGPKQLTDTYVIDLFTGPVWECLDEGSWSNNVLWLKQVRQWCTCLCRQHHAAF